MCFLAALPSVPLVLTQVVYLVTCSTATECLDAGVIVKQLDEVGVPENLMPKTFPSSSTKDDTVFFFPRSVTTCDLCPLAKPTFSAQAAVLTY
jgi:hypothetical protein